MRFLGFSAALFLGFSAQASFSSPDMTWPGQIIEACWSDGPQFFDTAQDFLDTYRPVVEKASNEWSKYAPIFIHWNGESCTEDMLHVRFKTAQYDFFSGGLVPDNGTSRAHIGPRGVGIDDPFLDENTDVWLSRNPYPCNGNSSDQELKTCIYNVTIHEIGHTLGLIHENARPDTPQSCVPIPVPKEFYGFDYQTPTPYDKDSIMHSRGPNGPFQESCIRPYLNNGHLSKYDIKGIQYLYGYIARLNGDTYTLKEVEFNGNRYQVDLVLKGGRIFFGAIQQSSGFTLRPAYVEGLILYIPAVEVAGNVYTVQLQYIGNNELVIKDYTKVSQ